ncbi:MAG: hypothetical protein ACPGR2_14160 [Psychrobium sp.]
MSYSLEPQSIQQRWTQQGESNADMDVGSRITQEQLSSWGQNGRKAILHSVSRDVHATEWIQEVEQSWK